MANRVPLAPTSQALIKPDRSMFMMSDDRVMMKQIEATHNPDDMAFNVRPLLRLVEEILHCATPAIEELAHEEIVKDKTQQPGLTPILESLSFVIDRISCEIASKSLGNTDVHAATFSLLQILANLSWDAKLVLTMAAFALNYGEFWLLAQIYTANRLAKAMATLKKLPIIMEQSARLKPRFDALNNLIRAMLAVTNCVVEFKELPEAYLNPNLEAVDAIRNNIPIAVYWTIRSVLVCVSQITSITSTGHDYITTETWDLSTLTHKINNILELLRKQLTICYKNIEEKRNVEAFESLRNLFQMTHIDNLKVLKALIYAKDDLLPLVDGTTKKRVNIEVLRRRNVLLLFSDLNISTDEISILEQIYNESRIQATRLESQYEVIWIPIVDYSVTWTESMQKKFESLQSSMPWYTVHHPSLIDNVVIRFIKEVWHFRNKPILVVLDPQGRVVSPNAIHMMWIWGVNAFPFTSSREDSLWRQETWRLELLVDGIDPTIITWIDEGKYIFVYGGDDIEWIRKFTTSARNLATAARIPLEMVYVGRSGKKEQVQKTVHIITEERLSYCWTDLTMVWFFWTRLESMLFSMIQQGKADGQDLTTQEIKKLLSFDRSGGWALFCRGTAPLINGHSSTILPSLVEYDIWKEHVPAKGFDAAFKEHHDKLYRLTQPCCRFEFPSTAGRIPELLKCPECQRLMEKYITFLCCHSESVLSAMY